MPRILTNTDTILCYHPHVTFVEQYGTSKALCEFLPTLCMSDQVRG